jgi:hypothetical protein
MVCYCKEPEQLEAREGGGDYPLQILADTFTLFQEEGRDYFKPIRTKDNIYKKHTH